MSNVKQLPGAPDPETIPVQKTIEMLEHLLERAKRGDVRSLAVVYTDGGKKVVTDWHNNGQYMTLVGGVSWLINRMHQEVDTD